MWRSGTHRNSLLACSISASWHLSKQPESQKRMADLHPLSPSQMQPPKQHRRKRFLPAEDAGQMQFSCRQTGHGILNLLSSSMAYPYQSAQPPLSSCTPEMCTRRVEPESVASKSNCACRKVCVAATDRIDRRSQKQCDEEAVRCSGLGSSGR